MLNINTNLSSLIAQNSLKQSTNKLNTAIERMSTGCKINHAKDNAANYSISTNMTTKIGAYQVAEDNALQGLDMINTASESLTLIEDKLMRLRALAEQSANGTYGAQSRQAINQEANALVDEINRIYSTAEYNGIKLFDQEVQMPDDPNIPKPQYDGFIKEVVRRDTSTMTKLSSVDGTVALADGTYSISTPEEMKKLADMTNAGLVSSGDEFVLANDIDLSQYENWTPIGNGERVLGVGFQGVYFRGKFDGNGFKISGLNIVAPSKTMAGLFAGTWGAEIKNLGLDNLSIEAYSWIGSLVACATNNTQIENCYAKGNIYAIQDGSCGGLVSDAYESSIKSSYFEGHLSAKTLGGISHYILNATVENCFSDFYSDNQDGASGISYYLDSSILKNCYVKANDNSFSSVLANIVSSGGVNSSIIENCYYSAFYDKNNIPIVSVDAVGILSSATTVVLPIKDCLVDLQISINSSISSRINIDTGYSLGSFSILRGIGNSSGDYLTQLDKMLSQVSEKQTEFGAVQNRLESVVEEIGVQYDNLLSSRSTLRDADIAEVSAEYIQQQILQQASATLLATANQSPSIALQLI